jgi:hypothetical protein
LNAEVVDEIDRWFARLTGQENVMGVGLRIGAVAAKNESVVTVEEGAQK